MSIIDIFWGPGFVLVALVTLGHRRGAPRPPAAAGAARRRRGGCASAIYLARRNLGHGEDARYQAMRRHVGDGFDRWALTARFGMQGLVLTIVSLPVQLGGNLTTTRSRRPWSCSAILVWAVGLDVRGRRRRPAGPVQGRPRQRRPGHGPRPVGLDPPPQLLRRRHPRGGACGSPPSCTRSRSSAPSAPRVMTYFLLNVSGKALLERRMRKTRPGYDDYVARTSGFSPRPARATSATTATSVRPRIRGSVNRSMTHRTHPMPGRRSLR